MSSNSFQQNNSYLNQGRYSNQPQGIYSNNNTTSGSRGREGETSVTRTNRNSTVKDIAGEKRVVSENRFDTQGHQIPTQMRDVQSRTEQPVYIERIMDKMVEVVIERPIAVEVIREIPHEIIVEVPVERRIERDVVIEKTVIKPIERHIVEEVEEIHEHPVEVIIEMPVYSERVVENLIKTQKEVYVENVTTVKVPYQRVVDREVRRTILQPVENEVVQQDRIVKVPQYVDRVVEDRVEVFYDREIEIPVDLEVEQMIDKIVEVPQYYDKVVERRVEVPRTRYVDVPVDVVVEVPYEVVREVSRQREVYKDVEKVVRVSRPRYVDKEVKVDKYVDVYVDKKVTVSVPRERTVEYDVERVVEVPQYVDKYVDVPENVYVDKVVEKDVEIEYEVERRVPRYVEEIVERYVDIPSVKEVQVPVDRVVERTVTRDRYVDVEVEVEKIVEVPRERFVDKIIEVEKIIERPIYIERRIEKPVERIVEKRVEVPYEKFIEVPVEKYVDKFIDIEVLKEKPVYVEKEVKTGKKKRTVRNSRMNDSLRLSYRQSVEKTNQVSAENIRLKNQLEALKLKSSANNRSSLQTSDSTHTHHKEEYEKLKSRFGDLRGRLDSIMTEKNRRTVREKRESMARSTTTEINRPTTYSDSRTYQPINTFNETTRYGEQVSVRPSNNVGQGATTTRVESSTYQPAYAREGVESYQLQPSTSYQPANTQGGTVIRTSGNSTSYQPQPTSTYNNPSSSYQPGQVIRSSGNTTSYAPAEQPVYRNTYDANTTQYAQDIGRYEQARYENYRPNERY
jgi:hypothetical protein